MRTRSIAGALLALSSLSTDARAGKPTTPECIAANEQAIQARKAHKLRAAREQLAICAAESCPAEIREECARRVPEVNTAIPTIVFDAKDGAGADLAAVKVTMDGAPLVEKLDGTAIPLDPGAHDFTFETPGFPRVDRTIVLKEGQKGRRETVVFATAAKTQAPAPAPVPDSTRRTLGLVTAGIGVIGIGAGAYFGLRARSLWSSSQSACETAASCSDHEGAVADHDAAKTAATVSTIAFAAGGVALVVGGVLFVTAPYVTPGNQGGAGLSIRGAF